MVKSILLYSLEVKNIDRAYRKNNKECYVVSNFICNVGVPLFYHRTSWL